MASLKRCRYPAAVAVFFGMCLSSWCDAAQEASSPGTVSQDFLLSEISQSLASRRGWRHKNAKAAEKFLLPLFNSLPKSEDGKLGNAAARYLLHRYFADRHGWFLHGLEPGRAGWNASAQGQVPREAVSAFVLGTVQDVLAGSGSSEAGRALSVGQLAVVASTIEHLIEAEYPAEKQRPLVEQRQLQCRELRSKLEDLAEKSTGSVSLTRFYEAVGGAKSQGVTSLRDAGVLDDVTKSFPSVIVSNYLPSSAQCEPISGYHSICCPSACEDILGTLEKTADGPAIDPVDVLRLAEVLKASRAGLADLQDHLQVLASREPDGLVRLHSREFSQWLHDAFPLDCPVPLGEDAAALHPRTPDEWMRPYLTGSVFIKPSPENSDSSIDEEEELLILHASHSGDSDSGGARPSSLAAKLGRAALMTAAVLSASLGLVRAVRLSVSDDCGAGGCGYSAGTSWQQIEPDCRERYWV